MTTLSVLKDTQSAIHFKQNHLGGWSFAILGMGICYLPQVEHVNEGAWIIYCIGGMLIFLGTLTALYRFELCLDLLQRKYSITKGFWPRPKNYSGDFENIEGLEFKKQWKTSDGMKRSKYVVWQTWLKFNFDKDSICLYESRDESQGRAYFGKRAKQLEIKTFEHTGNETKQRDWNKLDEPVSKQLSAIQYQTVDIFNPPKGLIFNNEPNAFSYLLPAPGFNNTSVVGCLFGLAFFLMGIFSTMISIGLHEKLGWDLNVSGSMTTAFILGIIFMIIGGIIIKYSIDFAFTKYQLSYSRDKFSYTTFIFNRIRVEKCFPLSQIEEFDFRESVEKQRRSQISEGGVEISEYRKSDKREIFIRTNTEVIKLRTLQAEISHFLKNVFYQNLTKNQPC